MRCQTDSECAVGGCARRRAYSRSGSSPVRSRRGVGGRALDACGRLCRRRLRRGAVNCFEETNQVLRPLLGGAMALLSLLAAVGRLLGTALGKTRGFACQPYFRARRRRRAPQPPGVVPCDRWLLFSERLAGLGARRAQTTPPRGPTSAPSALPLRLRRFVLAAAVGPACDLFTRQAGSTRLLHYGDPRLGESRGASVGSPTLLQCLLQPTGYNRTYRSSAA
jgi:hypothetical protein